MDNVSRPEMIPEQAKRLGRIAAWAPGSYFNKCWTCQTEFEGDKRAHQCLPCAVASKVQHARDRAFRDAADIARAIDSGRGNEAEIARAIEARAIERAAEIELLDDAKQLGATDGEG